MTTPDTKHLTVGGIRVIVVRKAIKNLHLGVYPPDGRVRVAAPRAVSDAAVRAAVARKLGWIGRQQSAFRNQERQSVRQMVTGESHYFLGRRYRLVLVEANRPRAVVVRSKRVMELHARPNDDSEQRRETLDAWYRARLRELVPPLLTKWQAALSVSIADVGIKRMKTKWGACNTKARRIWLNLELVKTHPSCIEYLVVHELCHLLVRRHDDRFIALLDEHLPRWRQFRAELNAVPRGHAEWGY
jgi:hypothetical protein